MEKSDKLRKLLKCCSDKKCSWYHAAWKEFTRCYDNRINTLVRNRLRGNIYRDFDQITNLVVSDVYNRLRRKLHKFDAENQLEKFDSWLTTFANRVASNYLRSSKNKPFIHDTSENLNQLRSETLDFTDFEVVEYFFKYVRRSLKGTNPDKLERDLYLSYLILVEGLDPDSCWAHPCMLSGMQKKQQNPEEQSDNPEEERLRRRHYIEVLISRVKKRLRNDPEFLSGLSES